MLKAEGRDTGGRGNAAAEIAAQAESLSPTSTRVVVTTDLHITGKVAQFGRGIIGDVSQEADGAVRRQPQHDARRAVDATATPSPTSPPPAAAATEAGEPRQRPRLRRTARRRPADAAAPAAAEAPRVRKIDGPATEPVDLAGVAGPAMLKRLAPIVLAAAGRAVRAATPALSARRADDATVRRCAPCSDASRWARSRSSSATTRADRS